MSEPLFASLPDLQSELESTISDLQWGDFHQRWDAAKRLPRLGDRAIVPVLRLIPVATDDSELLWFVARILGDFQHPIAVAALVNLLESALDPEIAAMAAMALVNSGEMALPTLTQLLKQQSTRLVALQALAQIQHPAVLSVLLESATDESADVRAVAVSALSQFQTPQALDAFWAGLTDEAASVRRAAVMALGARVEQVTAQVSASTLVDAISPLLDDPELEVARQAALALGRIGSESAIAVLGCLLQGKNSSNRQIEVLHALVWTEQPAALAEIQQYLQRHPAIPTALGQEILAVLGRVTVCRSIASQILLDLLTVAHPIAQTVIGKQQIALGLGQLQQPEAIDTLIDLLADSAVSVRLHVMAALKQFEAQRVAEQMQQRLVHPDSSAELKARIVTALPELSFTGPTSNFSLAENG